jgi:FkbM family methyltransferase
MRWIYRQLRKVRPTPLAAGLGRLLGVERVYVSVATGQLLFVDPLSILGAELIERGIYEDSLTRTISAVLRPGDTFIDVGANEGYFTVLAADRVGDGGKVIALEPQSRLQSVLRENLRVNRCTNVELLPQALGDAPGQLELRLAPALRSGSSGFYYHGRFSDGREMVTVTTLDLLCDHLGTAPVRLLKLDCEGAELSILRGAQGLLAAQRFDFLSIDYHPTIAGPLAAPSIDALVRSFGYEVSKTRSGVWLYHLPGRERELDAVGPMTPVAPLASATEHL